MQAEEYVIMSQLENSHWWFIGKRFLIQEIVERLKPASSKARFLDVGCGTGMIYNLLSRFGPTFGIECAADALRCFEKKRNLIQADAGKPLPLRDSTFAIVTCLDVLEHLNDDKNVLHEICRVCEPGGHIILTVPAFEMLWSEHDVSLHHRRRYTRNQLLSKVKPLDLKLIRCTYYNTIFFFPILLTRWLKSRLSLKRARSDFNISVPDWLNKMLRLVYLSEIRSLKFFSFPVGVSLLVVLKKT